MTTPLAPAGPASPDIGERARQSRSSNPARLSPWQVHSVVRLMLEQIAERISTTALAHACGLSRGHFSCAFRNTFGLPPHSWRQLQRVRLAKSLLADELIPLTDIAARCGFADQAHFTRAFKACTDTTPLAWRRAHNRRCAVIATPQCQRCALPGAGCCGTD